MSQHRETGEVQPDSVGPERQEKAGSPIAHPGAEESGASPMAAPGPVVPPRAPQSQGTGIWPPATQAAPPAPPTQPFGAVAPGTGSEAGREVAHASRKHLIFGAAGLGIGLIVGLGLGQINIPFASSAINDAAETCNVTETAGIDIGDNGQSISMSSEGNESAGAEYSDISCVLGELEVPDSVDNRIGTTRALDGRQTADWDEFTASWGYHPDSGLNIVIEIADK